jgi:signal transduction histidine kinase
MSSCGFVVGAVSITTVSTATLLVVQVALIAYRLPSCSRRAEPFFLCLFSLALGFRLFLTNVALVRLILDGVIVWSAGAFCMELRGPKRRTAWGLGNAAFLLVLLFADALGYGATYSNAAFQAFGTGLLAAYPLALLLAEGRRSRSVPLLAGFAFASLWLASTAADAIRIALGARSFGLTAIPLLLLTGCTGWLVFVEGYPFRSGWRGRQETADNREKLLRTTWARLLETEDALAFQDGLIASGLLALGAAHEFKNSLSHIRSVAQHALAQADAKGKDESLRLLLQLAEAGKESAIEFLEKLAREGRERARSIDASRDLAGFLRLARVSCRGEGVLLTVDLAPDVRFTARRNEVEQVLLNLIQNAIESYGRGGTDGESVISLSARCEDGNAVIEVRDKAGGIASGAAHRLFTLSFSETGSTGIGLYLSRSLAARNGGTLEHVPIDGGSCFRLVFPVTEGEELT